MNRVRKIRSAEALAMDPKAVYAGQDAFFWLWGSNVKPNERMGANKEIAVVYAHEPFDHHRGDGDSYDDLDERVESAFSGADCAADDEEGTPPKAVVLCLDSPGGVVSGLNECVKKLRGHADAAGIPFIACINEMAASAAYAIASACDEIYLPDSGIAGSIGVISTMVDQTKMDAAMGLRFVTLTSGARKSDGHPHVAISEDAIAAEQNRVTKLAAQFYRIVQKSRGLSPDTIKGYEAGIFLGYEAVKAGLADGIMSLDDVVSTLSDADSELATPTNSNRGVKNPLVSPQGMKPGKTGEAKAMLKLKALIKQTKAAIASEKDAKKLDALKAKLTAFQETFASLKPEAKSVHVIEHKERKTSDDAPPASDEDEDEEEDEEEEAAAEGNETDRSDTPEDDEDDDEDDDEESEESEEEEAMYEDSEEEAAAAKVLRSSLLSGVKDKAQRAELSGKLASILAKASKFDKIGARLGQLEADAKDRQKASFIQEAVAKRRITPGEAKTLKTKKLAFVKAFLEMRPKAIVHSTQEDLIVPKGGRGANGVPAEMMAVFQQAVAASDGKIPIEKFIADYKAQTNGAGTREF